MIAYIPTIRRKFRRENIFQINHLIVSNARTDLGMCALLQRCWFYSFIYYCGYILRRKKLEILEKYIAAWNQIVWIHTWLTIIINEIFNCTEQICINFSNDIYYTFYALGPFCCINCNHYRYLPYGCIMATIVC